MNIKDIDIRELAHRIYLGRIQEAWGSAWVTRDQWPKDDKAWRQYPHFPIAEVDLALASARSALVYLRELEET